LSPSYAAINRREPGGKNRKLIPSPINLSNSRRKFHYNIRFGAKLRKKNRIGLTGVYY
jgi:hypothetical protein